MKLRNLMDAAFDETWFRVKDGDRTVDVWNADYFGGYQPVMDEIEDLLDRDVDEYYLEIIKDPEASPEYPKIPKKTPAIVVYLLEKKRRRAR
jgi:hypothetical protein